MDINQYFLPSLSLKHFSEEVGIGDLKLLEHVEELVPLDHVVIVSVNL